MSVFYVYGILAASIVVRAALGGSGPSGDGPRPDGGDLILIITLAIIGALRRAEPLNALGVSSRPITGCTMLYAAAISAAIVFVNRVIQRLIRRIYPCWTAKARVNPGGAYLAISRFPCWLGLPLGLAFTASGAFLEELVFRSLVLEPLVQSLGWVTGNTLQAAIFGVIHGIPMAVSRAPTLVVAYSTLMPLCCGLILAVVARDKGIIAAWAIHWAINYGALVCSMATTCAHLRRRIGGRWRRIPKESGPMPEA